MKPDLYIIAAGKGSRMGGDVPKALVPITDQPNIVNTLEQASGKFGNIFIVVNEDPLIDNQWREWIIKLIETEPELASNVFLRPIISGLGDGHATLAGLVYAGNMIQNPNIIPSDDVVICWGDAFIQHSETFDEILRDPRIKGRGYVPVVPEENPYVNIHVSGDIITGASFSKLGETSETGLHDQSIFRFDRNLLVAALSDLNNAFWRNDKYMTPNGELSLLYTFHYITNSGIGLLRHYYTQYPTLSFNTPEEVASIQQEIHEKWKHRFKVPS